MCSTYRFTCPDLNNCISDNSSVKSSLYVYCRFELQAPHFVRRSILIRVNKTFLVNLNN